jgi:hypothetical protein
MTGLLSRENWNSVGLRWHRRLILLIYAGQRGARARTPERSRIGFVGSSRILDTGISLLCYVLRATAIRITLSRVLAPRAADRTLFQQS